MNCFNNYYKTYVLCALKTSPSDVSFTHTKHMFYCEKMITIILDVKYFYVELSIIRTTHNSK